MWYPEWFDSFEQFALSATLCIAFGCSLELVRIQETLRDIEKELRERPEREREEIGEGVKEDER